MWVLQTLLYWIWGECYNNHNIWLPCSHLRDLALLLGHEAKTLVGVTWAGSFLPSIWQINLQLPFWGPSANDSFIYDLFPLLKLTSTDIQILSMTTMVLSSYSLTTMMSSFSLWEPTDLKGNAILSLPLAPASYCSFLLCSGSIYFWTTYIPTILWEDIIIYAVVLKSLLKTMVYLLRKSRMPSGKRKRHW